MFMEIVISVILLLLGVTLLVLIHVCIVGRAFNRSNNNGNTDVQGRNIKSPSMSSEDIVKLPCFDYMVEELENRAVECVVCLENFKLGEKCRLLPKCNHIFHAECIDSWLLKTAACPICRTSANLPTNCGQSSGSREVAIQIT